MKLLNNTKIWKMRVTLFTTKIMSLIKTEFKIRVGEIIGEQTFELL
jgi:hypothetical protein